MIRVAVDAMGGDRGPEEIVAGAVDAASDTLQPVIVGPRGLDTDGLELIEAPDVIAMDEKPTEAVRTKPNSSLVVACRAVGEGKADAVVSAGNTGAMLAACLLELRRIPGVRRPAIAVTIPARRGPSVLLDSGANADARPEDLVQFAHMGAVFAEEILGIAKPEIRLLSIGEEPEKGNQLILEAHRLLTATHLNFADDLPLRRVDDRHRAATAIGDEEPSVQRQQRRWPPQQRPLANRQRRGLPGRHVGAPGRDQPPGQQHSRA